MRGNAAEQRVGQGARKILGGAGKRVGKLLSGKSRSRPKSTTRRGGSLTYHPKRNETSLKTQVAHRELVGRNRNASD